MGGHMSCYGWTWVGIGRCWCLWSGYEYKFEGKCWALVATIVTLPFLYIYESAVHPPKWIGSSRGPNRSTGFNDVNCSLTMHAMHCTALHGNTASSRLSKNIPKDASDVNIDLEIESKATGIRHNLITWVAWALGIASGHIYAGVSKFSDEFRSLMRDSLQNSEAPNSTLQLFACFFAVEAHARVFAPFDAIFSRKIGCQVGGLFGSLPGTKPFGSVAEYSPGVAGGNRLVSFYILILTWVKFWGRERSTRKVILSVSYYMELRNTPTVYCTP